MKPISQSIKRIIVGHSAVLSIFLAAVTLLIDFVAGKDIRFPLLYVLPIGLAAWTRNKVLGYILAIFLPFMRIAFDNAWHINALPPIERGNALVEALALALYAHLVSRKAVEAHRMEETITTKDEAMRHLRAFTRRVGMTLQGRGISPGLADGPVVVLLPEYDVDMGSSRISKGSVASEIERFERALAASVREMESLRETLEQRKAEAELVLVEMRIAMLGDPLFCRNCRDRITRALFSAEHAVFAEAQAMEAHLRSLKQAMMRERSADARDLGHQVLRHLRASGSDGPDRIASLPPGSILVAEDLLLSDALKIDPVHVAAIVTERTGPASHVAILARIRHIPAVCDIQDATRLLANGDILLVDAETGSVTVAPTPAQTARFNARKSSQGVLSIGLSDGEPQPCVTRDGTKIELHANISRPDEASLVREHRMDGVGLYRSEFLFLDAEQPPCLEAQADAYSEVAAMMDPRPVVIRTMDLGGDKIPPFDLTGMRGGLRGLAYSLSERDLFCTQILAVLRAAHRGNVKIMFPMVLGVSDFREAMHQVEELLAQAPPSKRPPIGAMIETPAAVFDIKGIVKLADFICIGTNDLTHAILASDRGAQGHSDAVSFLHPAVLRATAQVVQAALAQGTSVSVCGEAASDPAIACLLIGMGVRDFSMSPFFAAQVCRAIRKITLAEAEALASRVLGAATVKEARETLAAFSSQDGAE